MSKSFGPAWALILVAITALLTACATPELPGLSGRSVAARGGDAESDLLSTDAQFGVVQPGGELVNSSVRNEDRVQSTLAAPNFVLNLSGSPEAMAQILSARDAVEASLEQEAALWLKRLTAAQTDDERAVATARLGEVRALLVERQDARLRAAAGTAPNLQQLTTLIFAPVNVQGAGVPPDRLNSAAATAAAEALKHAIQPAANATQ